MPRLEIQEVQRLEIEPIMTDQRCGGPNRKLTAHTAGGETFEIVLFAGQPEALLLEGEIALADAVDSIPLMEVP